MPEIKIVEKIPDFEEYFNIVSSLGWTNTINVKAYREAMKKTLYGVVAYSGGLPAGMGRVTGSGMYYYIEDLSVVPQHQRSGLGKKMMKKLMDYIEEKAPDKTFVGVFAPKAARDLYREFGFETESGFVGMYRLVKG